MVAVDVEQAIAAVDWVAGYAHGDGLPGYAVRRVAGTLLP